MSRANALLMNKARDLGLAVPCGGISNVWREYGFSTHHPPGNQLGWFVRLDGKETWLAPDFDQAMDALEQMAEPKQITHQRKAS